MAHCSSSPSAPNIRYFFRSFKGEAGLRAHQCKAAECVAKIGKGRKEVWIVPSKEQRSPWENDNLTKEVFLGVLGLTATEKDTANSDLEKTLTVEENEVEYYPTEIERGTENESKSSLNNNLYDSTCTDCGRMFKNRHYLAIHKDDAHSGTQYCSLCPMKFSMKSALRRHKKHVHSTNCAENLCTHCGILISRIDNLKTHEENCGKEKIRKSRSYLKDIDCTICDKKFSSADAANLHRKEKHIKLV